MTRYVAAAAAVFGITVSSASHATGGLACRPLNGAGPSLNLVIGHGIPSGLVSVTLTERARSISTFDKPQVIAIDQSWINSQIVWLDLVDVRSGVRVVRLRASSAKRSRIPAYTGTLARHGRITRVRCIES